MGSADVNYRRNANVKVNCYKEANVKRAIVLSFALGAAAFAQSGHFYAGVKQGVPTGPWGGANPYAAGKSNDYHGLDLLYGRSLGAKFGYTLGVGSMTFYRGKRDWMSVHDRMPHDSVDHTFGHVVLGAWYAVSGNGLDLYANCRYGSYRVSRNRTEETGELDDNGRPYLLIYGTEYLRQGGVAALEAGVRKRVKWGVWASASYNYAPLDEDRVKAGPMQWVAVGLGYAWGRR
jgi:hypothetical protein